METKTLSAETKRKYAEVLITHDESDESSVFQPLSKSLQGRGESLVERVVSMYEKHNNLTIEEACQSLGISYTSFIRKIEGSAKERYYRARALRSRLARKHRGSSYLVQFVVSEDDLEELSAMDRFENIPDAEIMRSLIKDAITQEKHRLGIYA